MENIRNQRDIKLGTRRNYLISEPNYHTAIFFRKLFSHRNKKKKQIFINKSFYLSNLEINKILVYNYVKSKYGEKARLCYMDTNSFIFYIKTKGIYKDIAKDVETKFDTSNYELDRALHKGKK